MSTRPDLPGRLVVHATAPAPWSPAGTVDAGRRPERGGGRPTRCRSPSVCTATEGALGRAVDRPGLSLADPVITGTTVTAPGPNTITVANSLNTDTGIGAGPQGVTGATEGYIGGTGEDFTLHGQCSVPGQPDIPTRYADGTIADGGRSTIDAVPSSAGPAPDSRTRRARSLLKDASYAWGAADRSTPAGDFVLTETNPTQVFLAQNPIVRVYGSSAPSPRRSIDPNGACRPDADLHRRLFLPVRQRCAGRPGLDDHGRPAALTVSTCRSRTVPARLGVHGHRGRPGPPAERPAGRVLDVGPPVIGRARTVVAAGDPASITVTNTPERLWAGLSGHQDGDRPRRRRGRRVPAFAGRLDLRAGRTRPTAAASPCRPAAPPPLFTPGRPAGAGHRGVHGHRGHPGPDGLRRRLLRLGRSRPTSPDGRSPWSPARPHGSASPTPSSGSTPTCRSSRRSPGRPPTLVPADRPFTGTVSCQYGTDTPIVTHLVGTDRHAGLRAGVLVGSVCTATEDPPGSTGQPVTGDPSYVWLAPGRQRPGHRHPARRGDAADHRDQPDRPPLRHVQRAARRSPARPTASSTRRRRTR